jgi:hypothetical protein
MNSPIEHIKAGIENVIELAGACFESIDQVLSSAEREILKRLDIWQPQVALSGASGPDIFADLNAPLNSVKQTEGEIPSGKGGAGESTGLDSRKAALSEKLGISAGTLKKLDSEGMDCLLKILTSGSQKAELTIRTLNAVHGSSPGREKELLEKLAGYPGRTDILVDFLNHIGTDDPFRATERAQVIVLPVSQLPPGAAVTVEENGKSENDAGESSRPRDKHTVRGTSGHIITGMIYCAYDKDSPPESIGFFSKQQAVTRPFETFNPGKVDTEKTGSTRRQRQSRIKEILGDIDLGDLERNPELVKEIGSPVIARDLTVYHELKEAIREYKEQFSSLLYGEEITLTAIESLKVRTDPGGTFLGWFHRQIEAGHDLPEGIRTAYESLQNPVVQLDPAEERDYVRGLLAYQRLHSYLDIEAALGGLRDDLAEYDKLPSNDPLRLNSQIQTAKHRLQEIASSGVSEIKVSDFGGMVSQGGLNEFRSKMNERQLNRFGTEYNQALKHFEFLMLKEGSWREDCLQEAVPMDRLKQSIYGAKIGVAEEHHPDDRKRAPLTQKDFRAVKDALFYRTVTTNDQQRLLSAMPIARFREMVEGVVVAYRKAKYLDAQLEAYQTQEGGTAQGSAGINRQEVGSALEDWKPVLPLGNKLKPAENLGSDDAASAEERLPLDRVVACVRDRSLGVPEARKNLAQMEVNAQAGLYAERDEENLRELSTAARLFMPAVDLQEQVATGNEILASPLVRPKSFFISDALSRQFLNANEVKAVQELAGFKPQFDELGLENNEANRSLQKKERKYFMASLYDGAVVEAPDGKGRHLQLRKTEYHQFSGEQSTGQVIYKDPAVLEQKLTEIERDYVSVDSLPRETVEKIKALCSSRGGEALKAQGLNLVDDETFNTARFMRATSSNYISKAFLQTVEGIPFDREAAQSAKRSRTPGRRIGPSLHFYWKNVEGREIPYFGFRPHKGRPVGEVVNELNSQPGRNRMSFFSRFIPSRDFLPHVKEIAKKIVELNKKGQAFPEGKFIDWLKGQEARWGDK